MRIGFYMQDGLEQLILTPESETEKAILMKIHDPHRVIEIKKGSFFKTRGGWIRHDDSEEDESTMLVLRQTPSDE